MLVGLGSGAVEYYNGSGWSQLQATGWGSAVTCMQVNWLASGQPQVLVGLGSGAVEYYDGSGWSQLQGTGWGSAINCASAQWSLVTLSGNSAA